MKEVIIIFLIVVLFLSCKKEVSNYLKCGVITGVNQLDTQIKFPDGSYMYIRDTTFKVGDSYCR